MPLGKFVLTLITGIARRRSLVVGTDKTLLVGTRVELEAEMKKRGLIDTRNMKEASAYNVKCPTNVAATTNLPDRVRVTWTPPAWATTYKVFRDGELIQKDIAGRGRPTTPEEKALTTDARVLILDPSFDDMTAEVGVDYTYTVKTTDEGRDSLPSAGVIGRRQKAGEEKDLVG